MKAQSLRSNLSVCLSTFTHTSLILLHFRAQSSLSCPCKKQPASHVPTSDGLFDTAIELAAALESRRGHQMLI